MSSSDDEDNIVRCPSCGSTNLTAQDGSLVCDLGHEIQFSRTIGEDADDFGSQGRRSRAVRERSRLGKAPTAYSGKQARELFLQAYQFLLWKQCHELIVQKGLPADLWTVLHGLWALRVSQIVPRLQNTDDLNETSTSYASDATDDYGNTSKANRRLLIRADTLPKLVESVPLCYLAILTLRLPISMVDLFRWVDQGDVTYIRAIRHLPAEMVQRLPSGQRNAFDASEPPRIDQFRKALRPLIGIIYKDMGVSFPPININILLYRFLREMTLPIEIYPSVKVLAEMCNYDFAFHFPRSVGQKAITVFPEAQLIALVTVAVKLLLPFDPDASRFSPHTLSEPAAQRIDWTTWLKIQRSKTSPSDRESSGAFNGGNESSSLRSLLTTTSTDVFDLTPKDLDRYMDWYQQTWANSDLLNQNPANKEILKLFPLEPIQPRSTVPQEQQISKDQAVEDALNEKLKAVHQTLLSRTPIPDTLHAQNTEDASNPSSSLSVIRPGENYVTTKPWLFDETLITSENPLGETSASNLTEPERQFWLRASEISGFSIKQLLRAVRETENKISKWLNSKRRTEYWEDIDSRKRTDETVERQQSSMNEGDAHADADHVAIADDAMVVDEDVDSADGDM